MLLTTETFRTQGLRPGVIELPTASEDVTLGFAFVDLTIDEIRAVVAGTTPSVTWSIRYATTRNAAGTEVISGGTVTTSVTGQTISPPYTNGTIPAGNWVWLTTSAKSGTVAHLSVVALIAGLR